MFEAISLYTGLDDFAVLQIITVSGICAFIVSQRLEGWMEPAVCTIALFASALASNLLFKKFGLLITANKQINGVVYSFLGLLMAVAVLVVVKLLMARVFNVARTSVQELRAKEQFEAMNRRRTI